MRIFISEYICSGACAELSLSSSLAVEGRAMLSAIIEDFAALSGREPVTVVTTWDKRLGPGPFEHLPNVSTHAVSSSTLERELFCMLPQECDAALVIAPEIDGILTKRCDQLRRLGIPLLNASPESITLCSDKLRLHDFCVKSNICTVPTVPLADVVDRESVEDWERIIVKPRDGAGSSNILLFHSIKTLQQVCADWEQEKYIAQPYLPGRSYSIAGFYNGTKLTTLSVAEQLLSEDGTFSYLGGRIPGLPLKTPMPDFLNDLQGIGLQGYIGVDFVVPDCPDSKPVLVEVNPRLTTSYIGYRAAYAGQNLATFYLSGVDTPSPALRGEVDFAADGTVISTQELKK